jgi:rhodanese-related sulfurtransferase
MSRGPGGPVTAIAWITKNGVAENRLATEYSGRLSASTSSRRVALRALGGAEFGAGFVLGAERSAAAQGAHEVVRETLEALNRALAKGDDSGLEAVFANDVVVQPRHRMPSAQVVPVNGDGSYVNVSADDLATMLTAKTFLLINVHVPYDWEIEGTDHFIPFDQIEHHRDTRPADVDARIVLYCRSGAMNASAAEALVRLGYTDVGNLDGDMIGWEQAGYPLVNMGRKGIAA